jgi:hypothetical protein
VCFGVDFVKNLFDNPMGVNEKCGSLDAPKLFAIHRFLFPHPVFLSDFVLFIGQQNKRQLLFGFKFSLIFNRIRADADDNNVGCLIFWEIITDSLRLLGSAAG